MASATIRSQQALTLPCSFLTSLYVPAFLSIFQLLAVILCLGANFNILSAPTLLGPAYRGAEWTRHGALRLRQGPVPAALPVHQAAGEEAAAHQEPHAAEPPGPGRQPVALAQPAELSVFAGGRGKGEGGPGGGWGGRQNGGGGQQAPHWGLHEPDYQTLVAAEWEQTHAYAMWNTYTHRHT